MAHPKRFELLTPRFVVWCSIQLSYGCVGWHLAVARSQCKGQSPRAAGSGDRAPGQFEFLLGQADHELGAVRSGPDQIELAAVAAHKFCRDREAEPGTALARSALERLKQVLARALGQAGAGIANTDPPVAVLFAGRDLD